MHRLSNIEAQKKTAVCSICGSVTIYNKGIKRGRRQWECAEKASERNKRSWTEEENLIRMIKSRDFQHSDAYLAGFIDADGALMIDKYSPVITVSQTSLPVLELLKERFEGHIQGPIVYKDRPNSKPQYRWTAKSSRCLEIVAAIFPYLVVKRDRAMVMIEYFALCIGDNVTKGVHQPRFDQIVQQRDDLRLRLKALNHRGV